MALSLAVSLGSTIQVGEQLVKVLSAARGHHILIDVDGKEYLLTDQLRVEIAPNVYVSYGSPKTDLTQFAGLRIAFEAPRSVQITRLDRAAIR